MVKNIILIVIGLISTVVLAFTSRHSVSKVVRALFWTALGGAVGYILYSGIEAIRSDRAIDTLKSKAEYSEVARLNTQGKPFPDGDISFNSALSRMMDGTYKLEADTFSFYRTPETETQLRKVIANFPHFPFARYALALCLRDRGDPSWRAEMNGAKRIFEITTSIPGHQQDHDDALKRINRILEQ